MTREDNITLVELQKNDAYLKEIGSKYSTSHYYDVSVHSESGSWRIELVRKPFEKTLDKNYHGKLFEGHIEEPRVFSVVCENKQVGWIELGYDRWNNRMRVWEFLVEEEFRKRGIGTLLMNHAVKAAKEKGARMLVLETQEVSKNKCESLSRFSFGQCELTKPLRIRITNPTPGFS